MTSDYRDSHTRPGYGAEYDRAFTDLPGRALDWRLERGFLDDILRRFYAGRPVSHLDFACGTGRVLAYLEEEAAVSVGVDLSPTMLEIARRKVKKAEIIEADLTRGDVLGGRQFNLITAFRFFPNAQAQLRREVMSVLVRHLAEGGCLVFNNHRNLSSLRHRLARLTRRGGREGMSSAEVAELVGFGGLAIRKVYHEGLLPGSDRRLLLPAAATGFVEKLAERCRLFRGLSQNLLFVCGRRPGGV